jgi:hypothetical protein
MKKEILYSLCCLGFAIMIGGAVYEHVVLVPKWSAAPPVSLSMFQGQYGLQPGSFWMSVHPVNLLLFAATLIAHWKTAARKNIMITLGTYMSVLVITAIYFVPELLAITTTAFSNTADAGLTNRAGMWESLSLVRLALLIVVALVLFTGLTKTKTAFREKVAARQNENFATAAA